MENGSETLVDVFASILTCEWVAECRIGMLSRVERPARPGAACLSFLSTTPSPRASPSVFQASFPIHHVQPASLVKQRMPAHAASRPAPLAIYPSKSFKAGEEDGGFLSMEIICPPATSLVFYLRIGAHHDPRAALCHKRRSRPLRLHVAPGYMP